MKGHRFRCSLSLCVALVAGCDSDDPNREDASEPVVVDEDADIDEDGELDEDASVEDGDTSDTDGGMDDGAVADAGPTDDAATDAAALDATGPGADADMLDGAPATQDGATPTDDAALADSGASADAGPACDPDNGGLTLPAGFCATRFADGLPGPRHMAVTPAGDVYVATGPRDGLAPSFVALRDSDGNGKADMNQQVHNVPGNGIAWHNGYLYFAGDDRILRWTLPDGTFVPSAPPDVVVRDLPDTGTHPAKSVVVAGDQLFVNMGSATNSCQHADHTPQSPGVDPCPELPTRGGVWQFPANQLNQLQTDGTRFAIGIRNANALALDARGQLYAAPNGRDELHLSWPQFFSVGDDLRLPPEPIYVLAMKGQDFGWPYCYYDDDAASYVLAPEYGGNGKTVSERCENLPKPVATLPAHWAPLGMVFYEAEQFPARYRHGLFIAAHGSRFAPNATEPLPGYNVAFIPFADGQPSGPFERFAEGFAGPERPLPEQALHRPAGVAVGPDGALFVSDDKGGTIWRVVYRGQ